MKISPDKLSAQMKKDFYKNLNHVRKANIEFPIRVDAGAASETIGELIEELESLIVLALEEFVVDDLIPILARRYDSKASNVREHSLYFMKGSEFEDEKEGVLEDRRKSPQKESLSEGQGEYARGFEDLRRKLTTAQPIRRQNGVVTKSLGEGANHLKLGDYSIRGSGAHSKSDYTNWFLAVELGTGVKENTGAWLRNDGDTKDPSGDGSWWLPAAPSVAEGSGGLRFLGQKGFHIFWQEHQREADPFWEKYFFEEFPAKLSKVIGERFPSLG